MKRCTLLAVAFCFTSAVAIGADDKPTVKKTKLKKLTKPVKDLFAGTWSVKLVVDRKKAEAMLKKQGVPADRLPMTIDFLKNILEKSQLTVTINADGTSSSRSVNVGPNGQKKVETSKETWKMVESKGRTAKIKLNRLENKKERTIGVRFISDDAFELVDDPDLKKVPVNTPVFRRVKPKK